MKYLIENRLMVKQIFRFGLVGTVGFLVDAGVLSALVMLTSCGPYVARIFSYLCAATVTWYLNRKITFQVLNDVSLKREWLRYIFANTLGALLNYGVFVVLVFTLSEVRTYPVLGVAAGSLAGMIVNFSISRVYVFGIKKGKE